MTQVILAPNGVLYDLPFSIWEKWAELKGETMYGYYYKYPDADDDFDEDSPNPILKKGTIRELEKIAREDLLGGIMFLTLQDYGDELQTLSHIDIYEQNFLRRLGDSSDSLRTDSELIFLLEHEYKDSRIRIVSVPENVDWYIDSDSENSEEWIAERHQTWGKI